MVPMATRPKSSTHALPVFVATRATQGQRANDFFFTQEGELVRLGRGAYEPPDGPSGTARSMIGMDTSKATTTVRVETRPIDVATYRRLYAESLRRSGYDPANAEAEAQDLLRLASLIPVGTVLELRGSAFGIRAAGSAPATPRKRMNGRRPRAV